MPEFSALEQVNPDFNDAFNKAALQGVDVYKAKQGLGALANVDLTDPTSVGNAINNSIKAGNIDQAGALANLNWQQSIRQSLPGTLDMMNQMMGSANGNGQPNPQANPQAAHAAETMNMAVKALNDLKGLPTDQRDAALAQTQTALEQRGVPTEAINSAAKYIFDVPDEKTQNERIDELVSHYQPHADNFGGVATGAAPSLSNYQPHATTGSWFNNFVNDPRFPQLEGRLGLLKGAGLDLTEIANTAKSLAMPMITQQAEVANAREKAGETEAGKLPYTAATELLKEHFKNSFEPITLYRPGSTQGQTVTREQWAANPNEFAGWSTEPESGAKSFATSRGSFLGDIHEFKGTDANGNPVTRQMTGEDYMAARAAGVPVSALGQPPSEVDVDFTKQRQASLGKVVDAATTNIQNFPKDDFANHQLLNLANSVGTGAYTKTLGDVAQHLAPIVGNGNIKQYATDVPLLAQSLSQYTRSQFNGALPRVSSEFNTITSGLPKNTSPQDQIKIDALLNIAKRNYDNEMNNFMVNNVDGLGKKTTEAMQQAWQKEQGGKSILSYAMPDLQKATINGKPAVEGPFSQNGHTYGIFLPGTKQERTFLIK